MKTKNKVLLSSAATIAVAAALVTGSTFALFTSESNTNIAVSSGTVSVTAQAEIANAWSWDWDSAKGKYVKNAELVETATGYTFTNGGTVELDGNKVTLDNITPGDGATIDIALANNSTVAVKYQVKVAATDDDGLYDGLTTNITYPQDVTVDADGWYVLNANEAAPATPITVDIELPVEAGNEYQGKTCTIGIAVYAVQYNASIQLTDSTAGLQKAALSGVNKIVINGDITQASGNIFAALPVGQASQYIDLNGHTIAAEQGFSVGYGSGNTTDAVEADIYISNGAIKATGNNRFAFAIQGHNKSTGDYNKDEYTPLTVHLDNVTLTGTFAFTINGNNKGITVIADNCTFTGTNVAAYLAADANYVFNNCTFSASSGIAARSGHVTLNNCTVIGNQDTYDAYDGIYPAGQVGGNGSALQIVNSNITPNGYGDLYLTVNGGTYTSVSGFGIDEINGSGNVACNCTSLVITGSPTFDCALGAVRVTNRLNGDIGEHDHSQWNVSAELYAELPNNESDQD